MTARGNRRQPIFVRDGDRRCFLLLLAAVIRRLGWACHAYCLMPNHYHLVLETPRADLSAGMQWLNGRYAQLFNHSHELDGHLFQGRFHASFIETDDHLLELLRYVSMNPVRAGLCPDPADWSWGSYRAIAGHSRCPNFLAEGRVLHHFGRDPRSARAAFRAFVLD